MKCWIRSETEENVWKYSDIKKFAYLSFEFDQSAQKNTLRKSVTMSLKKCLRIVHGLSAICGFHGEGWHVQRFYLKKGNTKNQTSVVWKQNRMDCAVADTRSWSHMNKITRKERWRGMWALKRFATVGELQLSSLMAWSALVLQFRELSFSCPLTHTCSHTLNLGSAFDLCSSLFSHDTYPLTPRHARKETPHHTI